MVDESLLLTEEGGLLQQETGGGLLLDSSPPLNTFPRPTPTLASVLRGQHTPVSRVLFLDTDLATVLHEVPAKLLSGSVTMERSRDTHRSASVSLVNDDGTYTPATPASLVWTNRIMAVERGAMVGNSPQYVRLITGVIDEPSWEDFSGAVSFNVWSRLHLADQQFPGPVSFGAEERVSLVIRAIAELAGLGTSDDFSSLTTGGQTLGQPRTFDSEANMLASMVKLAFDAGCELYDTGAGVLVLRPFVDPTTVTPAWIFTPGDVLLSNQHSLKAQPGIYNRATAIGASPDSYPIRGEWKVTNPTDPLYWRPDFDKPRPPYISADITTQQMANAVALRLGIEGASGEETSGAASVPIPLLLRDGRPVVSYGAEPFLLDRVTCPITMGAMSMDSTRVRALTG
jgi:hypothetical protein